MTDETPGAGRHRPGDTDDASTAGGEADERTVRTPRAGGPSASPEPTVADSTASDAGSIGSTGTDATVTDPTSSSHLDDPDDPTLVEGPARGRVRYQDPETTTPREPTVAEQRARRETEKRREAQEAASAAAEERQRKNRKRLLIGGGVAVGLVAVVAIAYAASSSDDDTVDAQCIDKNTKQVVPDDQCGQQQGGYYDTGGHFVPIFIPLGGFGGRQYQYNYGSRSPVGTVAQGGSSVAPPSGTTLRGSSGSTVGSAGSNGTVSRGGLGVGSNSSSGGSKGSSGSSSGS